MVRFLSFLGVRRPSTARAAQARRRSARPSGSSFFRPCVEGFEDRVVPAAPVFEAAQVAQLAQVTPAAVTDNITITGVNLTDFAIVDNVLTAAGTVTGTLAGLPFTTTIENFALQLIPDDPETDAVECSVLHLELAPIHLQLLGLHVDTSAICLDITATEGGGLLGDLLCGLAGGDLLGTGIPIIPIGDQLNDLLDGLLDILNGVLNHGPAGPGGGGDSVCTGQTEVLELVVGPLDLSLLGLNVSLDDCEGGPVQICVSATASEGLLGSLLSGLAGGRLGGLTLGDIGQLASRALDLLSDGVLSGRDGGALRSLLAHLKK